MLFIVCYGRLKESLLRGNSVGTTNEATGMRDKDRYVSTITGVP